MDLHEVLERVAVGEMEVAEAESRLAGYVTGAAGRYDTSRLYRRGIPEAIFGPGKSTTEIVELVSIAVDRNGIGIVTRIDEQDRNRIVETFEHEPAVETVTIYPRAGAVVVVGRERDVPPVTTMVGLISAGTSDAAVIEEAKIVLDALDIEVKEISDVGVANLTRSLDQLERISECDVLIVAAGREGALPTVLAGLVDRPVIGLPVSSGYGYGGEGKAALLGMLQSCTVLSVVNIDAGFVAGAQAGLIAQAISSGPKQQD